MKRKMGLLLLCAAVLLLAGCASNGENPAKEPIIDDTAYLGEYLDLDFQTPGLEIAKGDDGKYTVQVSIIRLTSLDDGEGVLSPDGITFTATDAAGNPISGTIVVKDETATVTFTDSTWEYLPNGTSFQYKKSSDTPNLWAA